MDALRLDNSTDGVPATERLVLHGIKVVLDARCRMWTTTGLFHSPSPRDAVKDYLALRWWSIGGKYVLERRFGGWILFEAGYTWVVGNWPKRPTRRQLARAIKERRAMRSICMWRAGQYSLVRQGGKWHLMWHTSPIARPWIRRPSPRTMAKIIKDHRAARPDPAAPDTLGWKIWRWDPKRKVLISPIYSTPWTTSSLQAHFWEDGEAVNGCVGIHAYRVPYNWLRAQFPFSYRHCITGIVERFGRAVVGPLGWRAQHVVIRKLLAPSPEVAADLLWRYPDAEIIVRRAR